MCLDGPEGEHTQLLHDMEFSCLVKVQDIREEARVPVKVKLPPLHVVVIAHLHSIHREWAN